MKEVTPRREIRPRRLRENKNIRNLIRKQEFPQSLWCCQYS